jgi:hypothetical protein
MDAEVSMHTFLTMIIEESVCFMSFEPIFFLAIILMWYTRNIFLFFFINWTLHMSDNLPERVQILGHVHILCITVREKRIICCQIFFDLLLKSAFERIFNVMQLILVKIKRHIKWKYLIQKFHDICSLNFLIFFLAVCLNISTVINIKILTNSNQQTQSYKFTSHITAFLSVVLITEMLEICIQTSYDQNFQLILKTYLPVVYGTPLNNNYSLTYMAIGWNRTN